MKLNLARRIYELADPADRVPGKLSLDESACQKSIGKYSVQNYFPAFRTTLVLVPKRLLSQWVGEFRKFLTKTAFEKLRIAQITTVDQLLKLRVGDIQCFDVILLSYRVLFDLKYRGRLRTLMGITQMRDNQCPMMNLLQEATGRFMRNCAGGKSGHFKDELQGRRKYAQKELDRAEKNGRVVVSDEADEKDDEEDDDEEDDEDMDDSDSEEDDVLSGMKNGKKKRVLKKATKKDQQARGGTKKGKAKPAPKAKVGNKAATGASIGSREDGEKAGTSKKRTREDGENEEGGCSSSVAPGQGCSSGGRRQFWRAKLVQIEAEGKKWPEWWENENYVVRINMLFCEWERGTRLGGCLGWGGGGEGGVSNEQALRCSCSNELEKQHWYTTRV